MIKIVNSNIVTAFDEQTIGSKVVDSYNFLKYLKTEIKNYNFDSTVHIVPGQGKLLLPEDALHTVSSGVGTPTQDPADYVLRLYRGKVSAFLKRYLAEPAKRCLCIVYTKEAYLNDPDIEQEETQRILSVNPTHVLVAVIVGPEFTTVSPSRFVSNLAGGNNESLKLSGDEIRFEARLIAATEKKWITVAD